MRFDLIALQKDFLTRSISFTNICYNTISSLYTLIFALFGKTETMSDELQKMKTMSDAGANYGLDLGTSTIAPPQKDCFVIPVPCPLLSRYFNTQNLYTFVNVVNEIASI